MAVKKLMSKAEYARYRGWSRANVTNHVKAGNLTPTKDGKIDPVKADQELEANSPRYNKTQEADGESLAELRRMHEKYKVRRAKLEVEQLEGSLVDAKAVKDIAFRQGRLVRDTLLAIPSRLAPVVANESDEHRVHEIILKEVQESLSTIDMAKC